MSNVARALESEISELHRENKLLVKEKTDLKKELQVTIDERDTLINEIADIEQEI
jgi:hypothetical protein